MLILTYDDFIYRSEKITKRKAGKKRELLEAKKGPKPKIESMENIARSIVNKRRALHLTQKQLASIIKSDQSVISNLELQKILPSLTLLNRIAKVFGTNIKIDFD